jgi:hypothetical protein
VTDIWKLQGVVQQLHDCEAVHISTIPVTEQFQGRTVWQGEVELFNLRGHPKAEYCYAWSYVDDSNVEQFSTVLKLPPVVSAETAVRADIIARAKNAK